ncbi:putative translation initiation factor eIF-6 [Methanococcus vannielii SB]|jgi:translation initiation factor 6|uniref:Translation initiation factor 6 n=1 Tax=Methanococcus vannielii (strain ATCC 35089 / DSM 1224 / JCM 13029 / OCM 148 / SB) TaxID=406327 RepID=IF6_METVS|nr:translation initiation factor IF-6 [Methanococcus vannielii]A6UR54.1 RecName: Full=Translation initiation factor 6; Short=aIF-6 [Methanococcus vannielii SB]ABR54976.1 putative translation initiation factor eIF-6 [Methanococcus vannielii SB]
MIIKTYFSGVSTIGVLSLATEDYGLFPLSVEKNTLEKMKEVLNIPVTQLNISNSSLIGSLCVGNSNGLLVPNIVTSKEIALIKDFLKENSLDVNLEKLKAKNTAFGNLILTNNKGCIISEELQNFRKVIEDVLGVESGVGNYASLPTVGSNGVATDKGCLVHPLTDELELEWITDVLKVDYVGRGTANRGVTSVGSCILANTKGAVIGGDTSGPELLKIEEALDLID